MSSDEEQIRSLVQTWQAATIAGDVDTVLGLMTDDAVFLTSGRSPLGKSEFAQLARTPAGSPRPKLEIRSQIQILDEPLAHRHDSAPKQGEVPYLLLAGESDYDVEHGFACLFGRVTEFCVCSPDLLQAKYGTDDCSAFEAAFRSEPIVTVE